MVNYVSQHSFYALQESALDRHEFLPLLPKRKVRTVGKDHQPGPGDVSMNVPRFIWRHLVVFSAGHQCGDFYLGEPVDDVPVSDVTDYRELVRPVHCVVDRLTQMLKGVVQLV